MDIRNFLQNHQEYKCQICQTFEWQGQPLTLEVDHIDGCNSNNKLENLRFLCPNCHSQTPTWRGRNKIPTVNKNDEEIITALKSTTSIRAALISIGLSPKGGNYKRASRLLNQIYSKSDPENSQFGTKWINKDTVNKKVKSDELLEYLDSGWSIGRVIETAPPSQKGKWVITDGTFNRYIEANSIIPKGWTRGKTMMREARSRLYPKP